MQVKKFEAKSIKDALQMVKQELGPEAIIISAKDNKKSFGLAGQGSIEVTAAISERSLQKKRFAEDRLPKQDKERFKAQPASMQKKFIENTVTKYQNRKRAQEEAVNPRPIPVRLRPPTSQRYIDIVEEGGEVQEVRVLGKSVGDVLSVFDEEGEDDRMFSAVQQSVAKNVAANAEVNTLKLEVQQLKQLLSQFSQGGGLKNVTQHPGAEYGLPFELSYQFEKLQSAGIDTHYIVEVLEKANNELTQIDKKKKSLIDAWVARFIMSNTDVVGNFGTGDKLQLFMGPAGYGKTSTLVKLAGHYVLKEKKRVAIFTADTSKVGAFEQLKIFCQILNVPLEVIKHSVEFEKLVQKYAGFDHILVDYPGMTLKDISEIDKIRALMPHPDIKRTTHLVLPTNCKDVDGYEAAQRYSVTRFDDLILTKVDESFTHGFIYNIHRKTQKPLFLFGTGSKIPEDLELATRERVLDLIYRLTKNSF